MSRLQHISLNTCDLKIEALSDTITFGTPKFFNNLGSRKLTVAFAVMARTVDILTNFENLPTKTAWYSNFERNTGPK
jgi:hypothetical protein